MILPLRVFGSASIKRISYGFQNQYISLNEILQMPISLSVSRVGKIDRLVGNDLAQTDLFG